MGMARSSWRALRPVLLAGAATLTWLTFSSPAASADALSDTSSLVGGVTGTVSSVTDKLSGPAPAALAPAVPVPAVPVALPAVSGAAAGPAVVPSPGLVQPVVGQVSGLAETIVAAVPVVNQVVPAGAVSAVAAPVVGAADGATAALVEVVVVPVAGAVPVLEPVLQPVADLATGTAPLPVTVPDLPVVPAAPGSSDADPSGAGLVDGDDLSDGGTAVAAAPGAVSVSPAVVGVPAPGAVQGPGSAASFAGPGALAGTGSPLRASLAGSGVEAGQPETADPSPAPSPVPVPVPAVPGSGAGSGASGSGSSGAAAWLSPFSFVLPVPGALRAGEISEHVPAPVSLDPGSSPD